MKFHTLVLEGDKKTEKEKIEAHPPVYTKSAYLHRKRVENQPPLYNRSFYLCRMIEEELKGTAIDGSGKITICAHQVRPVPGNETYICDQNFHISIYYLAQEEITALEKADKDTESMVMWEILRNTLLDIAQRSHCHEDVCKKIETAFAHIANNHFVREERIDKLTKRSKTNGLTAHVYRILSAETGEGWHIKIADRKGNVCCQETLDSGTKYVDRLGSRLYAKAEWRGNTFVIRERFGKEIISISVPASVSLFPLN